MTAEKLQEMQSQKIDIRRVGMMLIGLPAYFGLLMFLPAGTWRWMRGWLFILAFLGSLILGFAYLYRVNPAVVVARSRTHEGTKPWDKYLLRLFLPFVYAIVPVAALDVSRYHCFPLSWPICGIGYVLFFAGLVIVTWAESVNKFFEPTVRIQTDRGQTVVDAGPYAIVRHPGYVGGFLFATGSALCLGSLWALIPAGASCLLLVVRTEWEDQTLREELAGYQQYATRVRYKLIPGVW